jgi:hypothetical protein
VGQEPSLQSPSSPLSSSTTEALDLNILAPPLYSIRGDLVAAGGVHDHSCDLGRHDSAGRAWIVARLEFRLQAGKTGPTRVNAELRTTAGPCAKTVIHPSRKRALRAAIRAVSWGKKTA